MTNLNSLKGYLVLLLSAAAGLTSAQTYAQSTRRADTPASQTSPGEQKIAANSKAGHFTFVLFYHGNDRATQTVYQTLKSEATKRDNTAILPIRVNDTAERGLVERFDATRTPLPAVVALAPNGAVTGVFSQQLKPGQIDGAIVTPGYAECIKAMQNNRIVLLCVQPGNGAFIPKGVKDFQADRAYRERTQVINIRANDPAESRFLTQLKLRPDVADPQIVFMAPPGVLLGTYDANVSLTTLATKLVAAGKCCDDKNCKHHSTATGSQSTKKR